MNNFWKWTFLNIIGIFLFTLFVSLLDGKEVFSIFPVIISAIEFLIASLLVIFKQTRKAAQVMFAASGIVFLIGLGICSVNPLRL